MDLVERGAVRRREELVAALQATQGATLNLAHNTVDLLSEIGVLSIDESGLLGLVASLDHIDGISGTVREALLKTYLTLLADALPATIFQRDAEDGGLRVNPAQLPGRSRSYPYALLEFGIFSRGSPMDPFWLVAPDITGSIMELMRTVNGNAPRRMFSLAALKGAQRAREEAGRIAEDWAVGWERQRLCDHPFLSLVRSISDENAAAGFDIMSFDSAGRLVHDRFIEVKSYAEEHSFFWSRDEIEAARGLGMRYWLYLVDRKAIGSETYRPEMIQDPVSHFINRDPLGWVVTAQGFKFTKALT